MPDVCIIPMQQKLYDLYDSGRLRRPTGSYDALNSQANKTANPVEVALVGKAQAGHKAKYQITYVNAECDAVLECGDSGTGICDAGSSELVQTDVKTIDECVPLKNIEITTDQFRDLCNYGPDEWLSAQLVGRMDVGMRAINAIIDTKLCANAGSYAQGDSVTRSLKLIGANNVPLFGATQDINDVYADAGMAFDPILIGGSALKRYAYGMAQGGQTALGSQFNEGVPPHFYDNQLSGICPVTDRETLIALAPGIAQMVTYLYNVNEFQTNLGGNMDLLSLYKQEAMYTKGVLEDPISGHMWDMSVTYNNCTDKWIISLKSNFDIWVMRLIQCFATDFTGITKWGVCPLASSACDVAS